LTKPLTVWFLCETYTGYREFFLRQAPAPQGLPPLYHTWNGWAERGHRVHIFTQDYMYDRYQQWAHEGKWIHNVPLPFRYLRDHRYAIAGKSLFRLSRVIGLLRLRRLLLRLGRADPPDIIYSCSPWCSMLAWRVARRMNAVHVVRRFGTVLYEQMQGKPFGLQDSLYVEALGYRLPFDLVVMGNDGTRGDQVALHYGCPPEKLRFWTNGINKNLYDPTMDRAAFRRGLGLPETTPIILAVSRLAAWKRLDRVLRMMQHVKEVRPDARLLIVGTGEHEDELKALAGRLAVDGVTRFVGAVEHRRVGEFFNGCDVYVQFFDLTNRCNPLFEAMVCAMPVVTLDDDSIDDVAQADKTAVRVPADDARSAAQAVLRLLEDASRRAALGQAAREHIVRNFQTWSERIDMETETVLELVRRRRGLPQANPVPPPMIHNLVLGTCGNPITFRDGLCYTHHSYGTILEQIAPRFRKVLLCGPVLPAEASHKADCQVNHPNLEVQTWDTWFNTLRAMKRPDRLLRHYWHMSRACDALLIRGMHPLCWLLHWMAALRGQRVVHWIAANAVQILKGDPRGYGAIVEWLGLGFAYFERFMIRVGRAVSGGFIVTSGLELARVFRSPRTIGCPSSSTTSERDFLVRDDTCTGESIRVLFLGFIRPEKGIEYLIRALPMVQSPKPVHLALVGGWDQFPAERQRLENILTELALSERVHWEGYARFGAELFAQIDRSDMLVLPSLSEGTPHVLIEARARSLPVVASRVGGIPDTITDGVDGLLVPPRNPEAIAAAITRIINEPEFRRRLMANGRERVRTLTLEWFANLLGDLLTEGDAALDRTDRDAAHTEQLQEPIQQAVQPYGHGASRHRTERQRHRGGHPPSELRPRRGHD